MEYKVWTDGSCYYADRAGGWAFLVEKDGEVIYEDLAAVNDTTSARMEMMAIYKGMEWMNKNIPKKSFTIVSDYATVVNCFKERWYVRWIETEWYEVKNPDLWKKLIKEFGRQRTVKIGFKHVKGHTGIEFNERVDDLAGLGRKWALKGEI